MKCSLGSSADDDCGSVFARQRLGELPRNTSVIHRPGPQDGVARREAAADHWSTWIMFTPLSASRAGMSVNRSSVHGSPGHMRVHHPQPRGFDLPWRHRGVHRRLIWVSKRSRSSHRLPSSWPRSMGVVVAAGRGTRGRRSAVHAGSFVNCSSEGNRGSGQGDPACYLLPAPVGHDQRRLLRRFSQ